MLYLESEINEGNIPQWMAKTLKTKCSYCGYPILIRNNYKGMYCSNRNRCPGHNAARLADCLKLFGVKGYGEKTCEKIIVANRCSNHLEALQYIEFKKPMLHLHEIARITYISGIDDKWFHELAGYKSFEDYFKSEHRQITLTKEEERRLLYAESLFEVKEPLSQKIIEVMIHNPIPGYKSKEIWINHLNEHYGTYVQTKLSKNKKITDILVTVCKDDASAKVNYAQVHNIAIMTPDEYEFYLTCIKTQENNLTY